MQRTYGSTGTTSCCAARRIADLARVLLHNTTPAKSTPNILPIIIPSRDGDLLPTLGVHVSYASDIQAPYRSWSALMEHNARIHMERPWMVFLDGKGLRQTWSFAVFVDTAQRLASLLAENGVERGHRVAIAGHNHPDTILAYFACWLMGACAVPLNMTEDDARLAYILEDSDAKLVLCRSEYRGRITHAHVVDVDTDAADPEFYRAVRAQAPYPFASTNADMMQDECLIVYTSGTTGNPKGVVLVQQNLFADGADIAAWHGMTAESHVMCVLPVHHVNGTVVTHVAPFIVGATVVLNRKFSASHFWEIVRQENVNIVSVVPTLLAFLLEVENDQRPATSDQLHFICGAGPLTCELVERFETTFGYRVVHGYGLSETTCYTCFLPRDLSLAEHQSWLLDHGFPSIGVALPCNEMAIHSEQGEPLGPGQRGEIVARGANIMKGYNNNAEANAKAFEFGWFRSGDEGFYLNDASGRAFYFITGRIKELIIRGGVNLAPLEIDEVINRAPGVRAGICVGFENVLYGEEVGALVIPGEGAQVDAILEFCRSHLPAHKAPKVVLFTDQLPVTSTGKYQRNKVKHLFAEWKDSQFR
jgi:long-chain acyl-CoA synthetase